MNLKILTPMPNTKTNTVDSVVDLMKPRVDSFTWKWITTILPLQAFNNITINSYGKQISSFSLNRILVKFHRHIPIMEVTVFDESGKANSCDYMFPENKTDLIRRVISHCGDVAKDQLKTP